MHHKPLSIWFAFLPLLACLVVGAPVKEYHTVQQAVHGMRRTPIGFGMTGSVHAIKRPYKGHEAVVKVISPGDVGHKLPGPEIEAHNALHVGQLLGHGRDVKTNTHYLVMKNMGVSAERSKLSPDRITALNHAAEARYQRKYGVTNKDRNGGNYVYRSHRRKVRAEIVDWAKMQFEPGATHSKGPMKIERVTSPTGKKITSPTEKKVTSPTEKKVTSPTEKKRQCPTCVIM